MTNTIGLYRSSSFYRIVLSDNLYIFAYIEEPHDFSCGQYNFNIETLGEKLL